jgi:hypothetical protein
MLPDTQPGAFGESYKSSRFNRILDQKPSLTLHLATARSAGCPAVRQGRSAEASLRGQ